MLNRRPWRRGTTISETEAEGSALLCFLEDGKSFQGKLTTPEDEQFLLAGKLANGSNVVNDDEVASLPSTPNDDSKNFEAEDEDSMSSEENNLEKLMSDFQDTTVDFQTLYDICVEDLDAGTVFDMKNVPAIIGSRLIFRSINLDFISKKSYRGTKADILIQRSLGHGLVGQNCRVYVGRMKISYTYDYASSPKWCL